MDRYVFVVHLQTGRVYTLNKQLKLNLDGKGVPDSPQPEEVAGTPYQADLPAVRPDWAENIPAKNLLAYEAYPLLNAYVHQCRA